MPSIRDLYESALAVPPAERGDWLARHCTDDALRRRLLAMVDTSTASDPLARPLDDLADALDGDEPPVALPSGGRIGPFELLGVLGQGGFSTVYRGVRDVEGVAQEVAIKLLHRGLQTASSQRQFRREQRALAQLRHPNIARLIEGGVTDAGLPYIALELVGGERITEHVRRLRLGLRARLELFLVVCAAVEAAHRALIVHRDLKPANVLVTDEGHVKLLDFGIAKLLDDVDEDDATRTGHQPFTPAYAAPEQRAGAPVSTATDVYALGVLLGELVSGQRLNDGKGATPASYISGDEPIGVLPEPAAILRRRLRGDLGAIVQKALADAPERRYASAAGLADDVRRLLEGHPVSAQKPTRWYRARRFVQRHRGGMAMAAVFVLALLAAFAAVAWQADVARQHAQRADAQAARAVAVRDFLVGLLDAAQARLPAGQRPTVDQLVEEARRRLGRGTHLEPSLRADMLLTLGRVGSSYGDFAAALAMYEEAAALKAGLYAPEDPERWSADVRRADALQELGHESEAMALLEPLLPLMRAHAGQVAVDGLELLTILHTRAGHGDRARELSEEAVAKGLALVPPDSPEALKLESLRVRPHDGTGGGREQAQALEAIVARWRALDLPRTIEYVQMLNNAAVSRVRAGDQAVAEPMFVEAIEISRDIARRDPFFAQTLRNLALVRIHLGRHADAEAPLAESLEIDRNAFGPDNVQRVPGLFAMAALRREQGRLEDAELLLRETHVPCEGQDGANDVCARVQTLYASIRMLQRRVDEAAAHARRALDLRKSRGGPSLAAAHVRIAQVAQARGQSAQALDESERALEMLRKAGLDLGFEAAAARIVGAQALTAGNDPSAALDLLEPLRTRWESQDAAVSALGFEFLAARAIALESAGRGEEARRLARRALSFGVPRTAVDPDLHSAAEHLAAE
ncbi:serine/threonine-protein kinase [Dokdonella sp.]|uniref:serine/threonine-protein kinase n=1 Tax=Dokdonella sp. TaxID=2291710 RepID=UPI00262592AD|nr:serine/threonine-protein kinase [Dokdonella sp.]